MPASHQEIDRFDVGADTDHPGFSEMHPADEGHWVRYDDHLAALQAEREKLREKLLSDKACAASTSCFSFGTIRQIIDEQFDALEVAEGG